MNQTIDDSVAGIINLYKPPATSTAKYVYRLRPVFGIRKVGHAGTLDPFADGVVLACLGSATKLVERLMSLPKHYRTSLRLGVTNQTLDTEQPFLPVPNAAPASPHDLDQALAQLHGEIDQVPPAFSAVKIKGVRSYRLARQGLPVHIEPRRVHVYSIRILDYAWPRLDLEIHCARGTYIRAIARDLGQHLGCGACCEALTRIAVGPFHVQDAVNLHSANEADVRAALLPLEEAKRRLQDLPPDPIPSTDRQDT